MSENSSTIISKIRNFCTVLKEEVVQRDKTSLDIFWLKDKSLADLDNLPDPDVLANEIIENLESGTLYLLFIVFFIHFLYFFLHFNV